ncbi:TIGR04442 family protein [Malonomonas rubra DSM 5091]|uniref:TIGR04442 family protein n=1 Tax=Malonomonas rubra DSM 5091 TaxID=1122189 RepID=A0A1M6FC29_MALRU|nr:TIGR04442 family protein [Malonomonas rubra]SHI95222.1 TIGR04442 family protein [Malonomonas rubra DSM 5091]
MNTELRLHGRINDSIEYYATAAGKRLLHHHFYQISEQQLRLFSPGNELTLSNDGIKQVGNGGTFCEYMFGVDQPLADLTKGGILNRLTLHGASYNEDGRLELGKQNSNQSSYSQLFFEGHAVFNYAFFVDGISGSNHPQKQEQILRLLGRRLKRLPHLNQRDDSELATELLKVLPEQATLYLVRLINIRNKRYQQQFQKLYYQHRQIPDEQFSELQVLANDLGIDRYQQERIRVDVMYRHRDNYRIIDEYRRTLIQCYRQGYLEPEQHAQLTRLKTLSVRNKIPSPLFLTLDDQLKIPARQLADEPEYMSTTRQILQKIFQPYRSGSGVDSIDMEQLLFAKQQAQRNRDHGFEQLLLETGKECDEAIRDGAPLSLLENFSYIITFFDRYDSSLNMLSQMAFMENFRLTDKILRSLLGNQQAFNSLSRNLFGRLFFDDILGNGYLGRFGRRKLDCLERGLNETSAGQLTLEELENRLKQLDAEERLYNTVLHNAKERIRNRYSRYETDSEQQQLFNELSDELLVRGIISDLLDPGLFRNVIHDIKKEAIYLHSLLPEIISSQDRHLREDFLSNSGLDRFYVEELEREYFTHNQIDLDHLSRLRSESA